MTGITLIVLVGIAVALLITRWGVRRHLARRQPDLVHPATLRRIHYGADRQFEPPVARREL